MAKNKTTSSALSKRRITKIVRDIDERSAFGSGNEYYRSSLSYRDLRLIGDDLYIEVWDDVHLYISKQAMISLYGVIKGVAWYRALKLSV